MTAVNSDLAQGAAEALTASLGAPSFVALAQITRRPDGRTNSELWLGGAGMPPAVMMGVARLLLENIVAMTKAKHCPCEACDSLIRYGEAGLRAISDPDSHLTPTTAHGTLQ